MPELGAQSESDINGQITILENAVAGAPAAVVISPTEFKALGKPIDEAAKAVPIIGIDSGADSKAFTSFLTTDNTQGGRIAADGLAAAIKEATGKEEGDIAIITSLPGVGSLDQRHKRLRRADHGEISGPQGRGRQICRRPGHHRPQHDDRLDHRKTRTSLASLHPT